MPDVSPSKHMNEGIRKGQPVRLDDAAVSSDPDLPAFIAKPPDAPVYHGFPLLKNSECEGFIFGTITEPNGTQPAEWGDAFVVAPNGSRAGIVWQIGHGEPNVVCEPSEGRWGVYGFYFNGPIATEDELVRHLQSLVPALKTYYEAAENTCPESTRAISKSQEG
jgi:hypothetical protein